MFYNARWHDPYLNHFTQPDSIVPDPYNSQDWDRYSYARNNPLRYTDPTGHCSTDSSNDDYCPGYSGISQNRQVKTCDQACRREAIYKEYKFLQGQVENGAISSDLEAFARLAEYAAGLAGDCVKCFIDDLGASVTGHAHTSSDDRTAAYRELLHQMHMPYVEYNQYYQDLNLSDSLLGQTSFASYFSDSPEAVARGGGNQSRHFWFYVQVSYESGYVQSLAVNTAHETVLGEIGKSYEDFALGVAGADLGSALNAGTVSPNEVGNWIRTVLSGPPLPNYFAGALR